MSQQRVGKKFASAMLHENNAVTEQYFMRKILFATMAFLLPWAAQAQCVAENLIAGLTDAQRAELARRIDAVPFPEGNIWQATRADQTLYVIGTMHMGDARFAPLLARIEPLVQSADRVYLEASRDDMTLLQDRMTRDPSLLFIQSGPTLIEQMQEDSWADLSARLAERGIPGFLAAKMQPWYAMMMMSIPTCALQGMSETDGVDFRIMAMADSAGVPMFSLEDPLEALQMLAGDDPEAQLQSLNATLAMTKDETASFVTMLDAYVGERHREIWESGWYLTELDGSMPPDELAGMKAEMEQALMIDRNIAWNQKLRAEARPGITIIAVGAAHLAGEHGVLNLLVGEGYALTRVE